jgi:hypothetical protein
VDEYPGFAAAGTGDDEHWVGRRSDGLTLGVV